MTGCPSEDWRKCSAYLTHLGIAHRIYSTCRPPSHPLSKKNPRSDHIKGLALDTDWSDRIWDVFEPLALGPDRVIKQLIKSPQGSITNGRRGGQIPGHWDHVHVATYPGAVWPHERIQPQLITEDDMFDSMSGGWLEPGETDLLDFDVGPGNPAQGSKATAYDCYVKVRSLDALAKLRCEVLIMDFTNKPDHPYSAGQFVLEGTNDPKFVPEKGLRQFLIDNRLDAKTHFFSGHVQVKNESATRVKVWRSRYTGPA